VTTNHQLLPLAHVHRAPLAGTRGGIDYSDPANVHMVYGVPLTGRPFSGVVVHDKPATFEEREWLESYLPTRLAPDAPTYHLVASSDTTEPKPPRLRKKWRTRNLLAALGLTLGSVLLLAACGWHGTGTVSQRDYHPGYSYMASYSCGPKSMRSCFEAREMPPVWQLTVRDSSGNTHRVDVSEHDYDNDPIGSTFTNGQ
jgi:hypothetical protein